MNKTLKSITLLFIILSTSMYSFAQANNYNCFIKNITQTGYGQMDFDIWIEWTGTNVTSLAFFEGGIDFNYTGMANGGTITGSFVSGSASPLLPASQQSPNAFVDPISHQFRIDAATASPSTSATVIPGSPGLKIGTFRINNSIPFTINSTPNFTWNFTLGANITRTRVAGYVNSSTLATPITINANHTVIGNPAISASFPVLLSSFEGRANPESDLIQWSTSAEINNNYFILEYSQNGIEFNTLATINSLAQNGNSNQILEYQFTNSSINAGHNYYRLTQVDIDGKSFTEGKILDLIHNANSTSVSFYPNPTSGILNVNINSSKASAVTFNITTLSGISVLSQSLLTTNGTNNETINLNNLPSGLYTFQIIENGKLISSELISKRD